MQDATVNVDTCKVSVSDQGVSLSVAPLFAGQDRQCRNVPQGAGSGVGLQSHRSVDDQVEAMSAVLNSQLLDMVARGFVCQHTGEDPEYTQYGHGSIRWSTQLAGVLRDPGSR
jgi:hypothetical protein